MGIQLGLRMSDLRPRSAAALPSLYLGQVATRCHLSKQVSATPKQMMCRTYHVARDDITAIRIAEANWYISNTTFAETGLGASMIVRAAIEYPVNTCTQLLWSGSTSGTVATATTLVSDALDIAIPAGAMFAVRRYITCTAGVPFTSFSDQIDRGFGIDVFGYAASGLVDQTMSNATVTTAQAAGLMHYPAAILALTRKPALAVIGDSRNVGVTTTSSTAAFDASGDLGEIQRSIAKVHGCLDMGIYGEKVQNFVASNARRMELAGFCSHVCLQQGINDVTGGRSAAQIAADTATIAGLFADKTRIIATLAPSASSTDGWATTANQTPHANNAVRLSVNAARRALPSGFSRCWEVADVVESARDSGRWKAPGYTADGTHESEVAYAAIAASGAVSAADLVRLPG
jgi:hypothetical protein